MGELLLNRYKVVEKLGEGGMAVVWKVYDEIMKKEIALKEIKHLDGTEVPLNSSRFNFTPTKVSSSAAEFNFSEEFRTMNKLQYPYTVKVFDYGVLENGNKFLTMEIVAGEILTDILAKRKLEIPEIIKMLIQLSQTLNFIHSRLYVHRDIKSENIMVTQDGNIKLMDFGLMDRLGVTSDGTVTGTVYYIPPEVMKGGVINQASDFYSVGVLAYEMLAGRFPFQSEDLMEIIRMHMKENYVPLSEVREDVPPELEKIVNKLMEKDQHDRYKTGSEVIEDLAKLTDEKIVVETLDQRKSYLFCAELVGRKEEESQLRDLLQESLNKSGKSFFIEAPAGVGKSRLIQEFKLESQLSNILFLEGFCIENRMAAYQPFKEALKPVLPLTKKEVLDKYGNVLVKILPELSKKGYKPAPVLEELSEKARVFSSITGWLKEVSLENPFVLCIDDLHWSDSASLDLLNACIRELKESPVFILGAFRDDEVDESSPLLHTIEENLTTFIKLTPFNAEKTQELIKNMLGEIEVNEDFVEKVVSVTAGNPFFITETMRSLIEEEKILLEHGRWKLPVVTDDLIVSESIQDTVSRRLKLLSEEALLFAQIGSILGRELDLSLVSGISGLGEDQLFQALDELLERQFVVKEDKHYFFPHDRVRETLYSRLDEEKKKSLHEKTGRIIERKNADNIEQVTSLLSYHYSNSDNKEKAVKYLIESGNELELNASYADAIKRFYQAVNLLNEIEYEDKEKILFELRFHIILDNGYSIAPEICIECCENIFEACYKIAGGKENFMKQIKIMKAMMKMLNVFPEFMAFPVKKFLAIQYPMYDLPNRKDYKIPTFYYMHVLTKLVEACFAYSTAYFFLGEFVKSLEFLDYVVEDILPEKEGSLAFACVIAAKQAVLCGTGAAGQGMRETEENVPVFEKFSSRLSTLQFYLYTTCAFWHNNHLGHSSAKKDQNRKFKEITKKLCDEHKFVDFIGWEVITDLVFYSAKVDWLNGQEAWKKSMDLSKKMGRPFGMESWGHVWWGQLNARRGSLDVASNSAASIRKLEKVDQGATLSYADLIDCLVCIEKEQFDEVLPKLEAAVEKAKKYSTQPCSELLSELAGIYTRGERFGEAEKCLEEAIRIAEDVDTFNPKQQMIGYRFKGFLAQIQKDYESAKENFDKSLSIAQTSENHHHAGLTLKSLGEYYISLTQFSKAKECLNRSIDEFEVIENTYQSDKVKKLLVTLESME